VSNGKITAWNGGFAAPRIAREFLMQIEVARSSSNDLKK
jgi:hypothetical protein